MPSALARFLSFAAASVAPVLVALYVGATTFLGGTSVPWRPTHGRPRRVPAGRTGAAGGRRPLQPAWPAGGRVTSTTAGRLAFPYPPIGGAAGRPVHGELPEDVHYVGQRLGRCAEWTKRF